MYCRLLNLVRVHDDIDYVFLQRLHPEMATQENGYKWSTEDVNTRLRRFVWAQ